MRKVVNISDVYLRPELIDELAAIYPEGREGEAWFRCQLPEDDPRVQRVLSWLESHGLTRWEFEKTKEGERNHFFFTIRREYDEVDYEGVEYVHLAPQADGQGLFRDEQGHIKLMEGRFPRKADFVQASIEGVVVPDRVKRALETEHFRGVIFRPTVLVGGSRLWSQAIPQPWQSFGRPWWELTSDVVLPPLSPTMDLHDNDGNPVRDASYSHGCFAREGLLRSPGIPLPQERPGEGDAVRLRAHGGGVWQPGRNSFVALHRLRPLAGVLCQPEVELPLDPRAHGLRGRKVV